MPQYVRLVLSGSLGAAAQESWSCGINFGMAPTDPAPSPAGLASFAEAARAYWTAGTGAPSLLKGYWSSSGALQRCTAYYYTGVGTPAFYVGQSTGAAVPGTGSIQNPPQISSVFSLLTGQAGRSFRGRIYWPALGGSVSSSLKSSLASQSSADAMAAALNALAALVPGGNGFTAVVSESRNAVTEVTSVSQGDVLDTQRSRRDNLVETRFTAAV